MISKNGGDASHEFHGVVQGACLTQLLHKERCGLYLGVSDGELTSTSNGNIAGTMESSRTHHHRVITARASLVRGLCAPDHDRLGLEIDNGQASVLGHRVPGRKLHAYTATISS